MSVTLSQEQAKALRVLLAELSVGSTDWRELNPITFAVARCIICGEEVLSVSDGKAVAKPHAENCRIARAIKWLR